MFPIYVASKASLTQREASRVEKTERAKEETEEELTCGNNQISKCYIY